MTNDVHLNIGPYEVSGTVAKGPSATVLKATHSVTGQVVAIKVAGPRWRGRPENTERFLADGKIAAGLIHPHIARVVDSGLHGEDPYLAVEYVEGSSLDTLLKSRRLSLPEVLMVVKAVARGLGYAHSRGALHANLKPRNILLTEDFRTIKITDFGAGRMESAKVETGTLATGQMSVGTVHYASPELAHGTAKPDARSDLYSLGVVFYEMLTGRAPSGRVNLPSQLVAGLPSALDPIVLKCLAQDRNQRYTGTEALLADLERLEQDQHLQLAAELEGIERTTRRLLGTQPGQASGSGRGKLIAVGAVAALVVLGLVAWLVLGGKERPTPAPTQPAATEAVGDPPSLPAEPAPATTAVQETAPVSPSPAPTKPTVSGPVKPATTVDKPLASKPTPTPAQPAPPPVAPPAATTSGSNAQEMMLEAQRLANDGKIDEARKLYADVASQNPGKSEALSALLAKAALEEKQGKYQRDDKTGGSSPAALVTYRTITEKFPTARQAEAAFLKLGQMYEQEKKFDLAAQAYVDLGSRFPESKLDGWFKAGQLFDKKLKDEARAKQAYGQVPPSSPHYKEAQARLKKL